MRKTPTALQTNAVATLIQRRPPGRILIAPQVKKHLLEPVAHHAPRPWRAGVSWQGCEPHHRVEILIARMTDEAAAPDAQKRQDRHRHTDNDRDHRANRGTSYPEATPRSSTPCRAPMPAV